MPRETRIVALAPGRALSVMPGPRADAHPGTTTVKVMTPAGRPSRRYAVSRLSLVAHAAVHSERERPASDRGGDSVTYECMRASSARGGAAAMARTCVG